jgi:hypothetical protein
MLVVRQSSIFYAPFSNMLYSYAAQRIQRETSIRK